MAQVRNISADKRLVPHVGQTVDLDGLLDVPDQDFVDRTWDTATWELVTPPKGTDKSTPDAIWFTSEEPAVPEPEESE